MSSLPPLPLHPRPGRYRHYKGNEYEVISLARHSETLEVLVVYRALYGDTTALWIRPRELFVQTIELNGKPVARFQEINAS